MSHKGSWSRVQDREAFGRTLDAIREKSRANEPPRATTDAKSKTVSDPPKPNERADKTNAGTNYSQHDVLGEANDKQ